MTRGISSQYPHRDTDEAPKRAGLADARRYISSRQYAWLRALLPLPHPPAGRTGCGPHYFRVGDTPHVLNVTGHIGYAVHAEFRGHGLSFYACMAIAPLVRMFYPAVILTSDPDNATSLAIIEKLPGIKFLDETSITIGEATAEKRRTYKRRYRWNFEKIN